MNGNKIIYFDRFGVDHIPNEIRFNDFMPKAKKLLDYKNLFLSNEYEKNDKLILKFFQ